MPDQLEELFADLRADTLPRVRPPGSDAARHTVRRRRTTRTVTAAVALVVAGGLVATGLPGPDGVSPAERLRELTDIAKQALDTELPGLAGRPLSGTVEADLRLTFADLPPGGYTLAVTCAGPGSVAVDAELVRSAEESSVLGGQVVTCTKAPRVAVMTFRLPVRGPVVITAAGDGPATGSAAYALELADGDGSGQQETPDAESTRNAARAAEALDSTGERYARQVKSGQVTTERFFAGPDEGLPAGDYYFEMVCAGPGSLSVTVMAVPVEGTTIADTGATLMSGDFDCSDADPRSESTIPLTLPAKSTFRISAVPDQAARNRAGWAYRFDAG